MIVPNDGRSSIGLKYKDLESGKRYVIKQHTRGPLRVVFYRRVHLIELRSSNKAVVQWAVPARTGTLLDPGETVQKLVIAVVSVSQFLASEVEWDTYPHVWNASRKRLELDFSEIQGQQEEMVA